ncbi:MAG: hypothetical protein M1816_000424 [Peltula sp. TS41687]|nr:MAG: hypothetical protein M1816_000424 [Peltula sp. TS41687]
MGPGDETRTRLWRRALYFQPSSGLQFETATGEVGHLPLCFQAKDIVAQFNNTRRKDHSYQMEKLSRLSHRGDKWDVLEEVEIATASEDDVSEKSAGDVDGITYSFDAPCGPQPGSHILSVALNRAVATFEGKQTDKLIKEEYEVVKSEPDDAPGVAGTICEVSALDDLEDFELL